jgi:hypothetical protein
MSGVVWHGVVRVSVLQLEPSTAVHVSHHDVELGVRVPGFKRVGGLSLSELATLQFPLVQANPADAKVDGKRVGVGVGVVGHSDATRAVVVPSAIFYQIWAGFGGTRRRSLCPRPSCPAPPPPF